MKNNIQSRTFKFRVWSKLDKWFIENGKGLHFIDLAEYESENNEEYRQEGESNNFYIFQQFTQIFDIKGNQICEGDIIRFNNKSQDTKEEYWFPIYEVINDGFTFGIKYVKGGKPSDTNSFRLRHYSKTSVEIIGNIFENPKLLKTK